MERTEELKGSSPTIPVFKVSRSCATKISIHERRGISFRLEKSAPLSFAKPALSPKIEVGSCFMAIVIENPTAEAIYEALKQVPQAEVARLKTFLNETPEETAAEEEAAWRQGSRHSATRFFEEEEGK